jgi:serine/threonine protein phosphatase 1
VESSRKIYYSILKEQDVMQITKRLLAVGDIHGCLEKLEALLAKVEPTENDTIVFLGDYINRGPDSKGVVDFLLDFKTQVPSVFLLGNHEKMLLDYISDGSPSFFFNGGEKTLVSYHCHDLRHIPQDHLAFFNELCPYYETDNFIFVHAGLRPGILLRDQDINDLVWIRDEFLHSEYDWGKTIVYGHTKNRMPMLRKNRIGLDTGCVYSAAEGYGRLSCCDVISRVVWSV